MTLLTPPLVRNTKEDNHCLQACILSVLHAIGRNAFTLKDVDREIGHEQDYYSWWIAGALAAYKLGIKKCRFFSGFGDYDDFIRDGSGYLEKIWPHKKVEYQKKNNSSEFDRERRLAKLAIKEGIKPEKVGSFSDLEKFLGDNFIIPLVDPGALDGIPNHGSHAVLVFSRTSQGDFLVNDPGGQPRRGRVVQKANMLKAFMGDALVLPSGGLPWGQDCPPNSPCPCNLGQSKGIQFKKCHGKI